MAAPLGKSMPLAEAPRPELKLDEPLSSVPLDFKAPELLLPDFSAIFEGAPSLAAFGATAPVKHPLFPSGDPSFAREEATAERLLDTLSFGEGLKTGANESALSLLNKFLRGELGEPTKAEVQELKKKIFSEISSKERPALLRCLLRGGEVGGPVWQIYTKEFLDAMAGYVEKLALDFRKKYGRDPVLLEIAAGDGRLARALNERLTPKGISITATDLKIDDSIDYPSDVATMDAVEAAKKGDILLGSWWHPNMKSDLAISHLVQKHPEKTLVLVTEASGTTNSPEFWSSTYDEETLSQIKPQALNSEAISRTSFVPPPEDTAIREKSEVIVFRSPKGEPIPDWRLAATANPAVLGETIAGGIVGLLTLLKR